MSSIREFLSARDEYITRVKEELLGPGSEISIPDSEHELITNSPDVRYSIGILFPKNNKLNADSNDSSRVEEESGELPEDPSDEDEGTEGDGKEKPDPVAPAEEENLDEEISLAAQNMPSSLGFTFLVSSDPQLLKCEVIFATYRRATMPDCRIPFSPDCPEKYAVPPQLSSYVVYDNEEKCLKLRTGLNRKTVRDLHEQDFLDGDEYGIFPAMYKLEQKIFAGSATHQFTGGANLISAVLVLAIMILPTVINISESALRSVPASLKAASLGLGASRIQTIFRVTIPAAKSGIATAIVLGVGRAIGEAMAISLVSGSSVNAPLPFHSVRFLTTAIVAEMGYAADLHRQVLFTIGLVLFVFIMIINMTLNKILKGEKE